MEPSESVEEAIDGLGGPIRQLARAVAAEAAPGTDETGGHVECLVEAVMGMTAGLCKIAEAIGELAEAVRDGDGLTAISLSLDHVADAIKDSSAPEN
jgi:hypothetical protein